MILAEDFGSSGIFEFKRKSALIGLLHVAVRSHAL